MNIRNSIILAIIIVCNLKMQAIESTDSINSDSVIRQDTIEVVLKNGYVMHWKTAEMDVILPWEESRFSSINKGKRITRISMYRQMADTTSLNIYVPYKVSGPLRVGDLVMILLMHKLDLPIGPALGRDLHYSYLYSPIPDDLLDILEEDRVLLTC